MTTPQRKFIHLPILLATLAMGLGVFSFAKSNNQQSIQETQATYTQSVNDYYEGFNWNQTGATLKTALFNKIKITTAGWSYDGLWEAYKKTDVRPDGTHLWDIYADSTMYTLNDSRINHNYSKEGDSINREHVIPQSSFKEASPMKSDIHHVLPSDGYVNNRRSSYPHGNVTGSVTYTSNDGCKLGSGGGNLGTVFEPMPQYKGDIARIYFYFVTCYQDKMSSNTFSAFDKSTYPSIDSKYLSTYLKWAKEDPVSEKEIIRNNEAYKGQGNRNPFIDCPYAVGAIWDSENASDYGVKGQYTSGEGVSISKTSISLITGGTTTISATSTNASNISWTTSNSNVVSLSSSSSASGNSITLTAGNAGTATITAKATISGKQYSKTCSVTVSATKQVISISISGQTTSFEVDDDFEFGGTVTASYNDGTTANVTGSATFSGYDMSTAGSYTVTVSYTYGGETATESYSISISSSNAWNAPTSYSLYSGTLTEGYYLFTYESKAMKSVVSSSRLGYSTLTISNNKVSNPDENLIWYVSPSGNYWKILSINENEYAASTGTKNQAGLTETESDKTLWSCSGSSTYEFSNKYNSANDVNALLRNNGTYGFACYGDNTGGALTLYKGDASLISIDITTNPNKTEYFVGDYFDPTGLVIERYYSDSSHNSYAYSNHASEFTFSPSLSTALTVEDDVVEITYGGCSTFLPIELSYPVILTNITLGGNIKTSFVEGDTFSFGGVVTAHYEDDSEKDVTATAAFTGYNLTTVGNQTVTVTFDGESASYSITVGAGTVSSISVSGMTTNYMKNASFSFDGTCTATFANGYQKAVIPTSVSTPNMTTGGNKTITVSFTYNGKTVSTSYTITVNSDRTVLENVSQSATITWSSNDATVEGTATATVTNVQNTYYEEESMRVGTGNGGGKIRISTEINVVSVVVTAKAYNNSRKGILTVGDKTLTVNNTEYSTFNLLTLTTPTKSLEISTASDSVRINIKSLVINCYGTMNISATSDCVGLENFIDTYLHMDYTENLGYCKDSTHHYYSTAKSAFNNLNTHQRSLFTSNSAYTNEWERLSTWAEKNGDTLNNNNLLAQASNYQKFAGIPEKNNTLIILISIISMVGIASIGACLYIQKHKKND